MPAAISSTPPTCTVTASASSARRSAGRTRVRDEVTVATKAGRRLDPHTADRYNYETLSAHVDRSRENLGTDSLELLQLHCPPTDVYYQPEVFDALSELQRAGKSTTTA